MSFVFFLFDYFTFLLDFRLIDKPSRPLISVDGTVNVCRSAAWLGRSRKTKQFGRQWWPIWFCFFPLMWCSVETDRQSLWGSLYSTLASRWWKMSSSFLLTFVLKKNKQKNKTNRKKKSWSATLVVSVDKFGSRPAHLFLSTLSTVIQLVGVFLFVVSFSFFLVVFLFFIFIVWSFCVWCVVQMCRVSHDIHRFQIIRPTDRPKILSTFHGLALFLFLHIFNYCRNFVAIHLPSTIS